MSDVQINPRVHHEACGFMVIKGYNKMSQRMWSKDIQRWPCEGCMTTMEREWTGSKWTDWHEAA